MTQALKLSDATRRILANFNDINPSILITPGNVLRTISPRKSVYAKATITESFESKFAIYDLKKFLAVLSMFVDPALEIEEKSMTISEGPTKIRYMFADPSVIIAPVEGKEIKLPSADVNFKLTAADYQKATKGRDVLSLPELVFIGEDGNLLLRATDSKDPTGDRYDVEVGKTDSKFNVVFKSDNLNMVSSDYNVTISSKGPVAHFESLSIEYWVSAESKVSTFG